MKAKVFNGDNLDAVVSNYNSWAKDKPLTRDVIVHDHVIQPLGGWYGAFFIIVYFDEVKHPDW
jgi:hypothetical protein